MKLNKIHSVILLAVFAFAFSVSIAKAETTAPASANVPKKSEVTGQGKPPLPPVGSMGQKMMDARKDIRTDKKDDIKNVRDTTKQNIGEMRDKMMQDRKTAGTKEEKQQITQDFKGARKDAMKTMKLKNFEIRKDALVKQLELTYTNLTNIRARLNTYITKLGGEGKDVTDATAKLAIADQKIAVARTALDAFIALPVPTPGTGTTTGTASTTVDVDLSKPRAAGDAAIKALKDARGALGDVLKTLHVLVGDNNEGSTTPSVNH